MTREMVFTKNGFIGPTIHLNGTTRAELKENLMAAYRALNAAEEALVKTAPHGRDYYVQPGDVFKVARAQFEARVRKVRDVRDEMVELVRCIDEQEIE